MINLLPPEQKQVIRYARLNSRMLGWLNGAAIVFAGLAVITGGSLFYLNQDITGLQRTIDDAEHSLKVQKEDETLKQVAAMSGNFSLVVDVLSREVQFSKLLQHLGTLMPSGTILQDLSLSRDGTRGLTLTIGATDYDRAAQALVNLQSDQSLLFAGADATSVNCENDDLAPYICIAEIQTILTEDNPFLLLNQGVGDE